MLRAAAEGRVEMTHSSEPDMFVDGLSCCDQQAAHELANRGLVRPATPGPPGSRAPAMLTDSGIAALRMVAKDRSRSNAETRPAANRSPDHAA